jgi:hypothetical protein
MIFHGVRPKLLVDIFLAFSLTATCSLADQGSASALPKAFPAISDTQGANERYGRGDGGILGFYQRFISPVKGGNTCSMHPSCSQYAKMAMERLAPIVGFAASCDRFIRCGRDEEQYPRCAVDGALRMHDPISDSDRISTGGAFLSFKTAETAQENCCGLAEYLVSQKSFGPAMLEFERQLYQPIDLLCKRHAAFGVLSVSYRTDELDRFVSVFYRIADTIGNDSASLCKCGLLLAQRYYLASRFDEALSVLSRYAQTDSTPLQDNRRLVAALCRLNLNDPTTASASADSISPASPLRTFTESLVTERNNFNDGRRSLFLAGALSLAFPGAGYLYAKRPQTALASLIINGLFFWTTYDFLKSKHYGAAVTAIALGSGFYFGGIRGSIKAAKDYNKKTIQRKITRLLENVQLDW